YDLIARYDIVDGLRLADPIGMQVTFDRLIASARGGAAPAGPGAPAAQPFGPSPPGTTVQAPGAPLPGRTPPGSPTPVAPGGGRPGGIPGAGGAAGGRMQLTQPDQALDAVRVLLSQSGHPSAVVLDFSDKLVTAPDRQSEPELKLMVQARKIIQHAASLERN